MLIASWIEILLKLLVVHNWSNNLTMLHISINNHKIFNHLEKKKTLNDMNEVGFFLCIHG